MACAVSLVHAFGHIIGQVMGKVGADDDQGFRAAPQLFQHFRHFLWRGVAHRQRHQAEIVQHHLQEGQLYFQRMFPGVGREAFHHLRQAGGPRHGLLIQRNDAQRGFKTVYAGQRQPAHRHAVHRAEQHYALDLVAQRDQPGIGTGGDGAGIDVAGVGYNQGLGRAWRQQAPRLQASMAWMSCFRTPVSPG